MDNLGDIQDKLRRATDPSDEYSMDDFSNEFDGVREGTLAASNPDYFKIKLNCLNESNNPNPEYAHEGDSGFDLRANIAKPITITPMERTLVPTGLFFEIPPNFEIQIRPRSGLAWKEGITVLNTPGTIDAGYRGEIKIILINLGQETVTINHGDRIAQAVLSSVTAKQIVNINMVKSISNDTDRKDGGFGSTGTN
jgi:dUTP pyrophosphatase